ncbi:G2/mitotic-specific cyclin [Myotisia sp. PD_48]|nr:G2/mitotic-specific cyclin [Myotisia sp. PD_48]
MPPTRSIRQRQVTNENDENATATSRLTKAKSVVTATDAQTTTTATKRSTLQAKTTSNAPNTGVQRKRAALGDVSNVIKTENGDVKELKKPAPSRVTLTSKASVQTGGVQKITRTNTSRQALGVRDSNKREPKETTEIKRPGSGSGVLGGLQVKRQQTQKSTQGDNAVGEEPPRKKIDNGKSALFTKPEVEEDVKELVKEEEAEVEDDQEDDVVVDLDAEDSHDPVMVMEYVVDIFEYLREIEPATMPNPDYMDHQDELEWEFRGILVDWLIEVHTRFRLLPETLFLTVNIVDRFLSAEVVALDRLQLVGVTAMFIASKYEEVLSPHVASFTHVADNTFTDKEILDAERHILATLNYDISYPNPMNFLRRVSKADDFDGRTRTLGKYFMEISLLDYRLMPYRQSHIAAASMFLARLIFNRGPWDATITHYSNYTQEEIIPVYELLVDYLCRPTIHDAFFRKYAGKRFLKALGAFLERLLMKKCETLILPGTNRTMASHCAFCAVAEASQPFSPTSPPSSHTLPSSDGPGGQVFAPEQPAAFLILSTKRILAFLDIMPLTRGHVLVVPRKHYQTLGDVGIHDSRLLGQWLPIISRVVVRTVLGEGVDEHGENVGHWNVVQNNGERASQTVPHVHFHIIPRPPLDATPKKGGWAMFGRGQRDDLDDEEAEELAKQLRTELAKEVRKIEEVDGISLADKDLEESKPMRLVKL